MNWNTLLHPAGSPFVALRRDFERQLGLENPPSYAGMTVLEFEDRWTVSVDLPGLSEADIQVTWQDGSLVIEGERAGLAVEGSRELFNDRSAGKFRRVLKVREGVDPGSIEAELQHGVLTLTLRRTAEAGSRRIPIRGRTPAETASPDSTSAS
ncbi:MAG: Spore protein [Planctomycetota bacterium]|jgi:HSP20 family protein